MSRAEQDNERCAVGTQVPKDLVSLKTKLFSQFFAAAAQNLKVSYQQSINGSVVEISCTKISSLLPNIRPTFVAPLKQPANLTTTTTNSGSAYNSQSQCVTFKTLSTAAVTFTANLWISHAGESRLGSIAWLLRRMRNPLQLSVDHAGPRFEMLGRELGRDPPKRLLCEELYSFIMCIGQEPCYFMCWFCLFDLP